MPRVGVETPFVEGPQENHVLQIKGSARGSGGAEQEATSKQSRKALQPVPKDWSRPPPWTASASAHALQKATKLDPTVPTASSAEAGLHLNEDPLGPRSCR